ncbi:Fic/DOC family protein [Sphingobium sp. AP50]|uniref:Fic/DOC family protein n=1 Tax=Sphingobium sp. AP50 TaxID=1884369 RepID=UPI000B876C59|nr:Fic family protein [Sphingobium sp. AP50]
MADPYSVPGGTALRNKLGITDPATLKKAEYRLTVERMMEAGKLQLPASAEGYRQLHRHIFQDVYVWAGENRTVDMSKPGAFFARASFIERELARRFDDLAVKGPLKGQSAPVFADRVGEHLVELNAIHPFREGNGRTMRAHLHHLARDAGHDLSIARIDPGKWIAASITGMQTTDHRPMRDVILGAIKEADREREIAGAPRTIAAHRQLMAAVVQGALGSDPAAAARVLAAGTAVLKAHVERGKSLRPAEVRAAPKPPERSSPPYDRER